MELNSIKDAQGKTIEFVELIDAEFGRTYSQYLCLSFNDGTKIMLASQGDSKPWQANPDVEDMQKATNYFSAKDIADKVLNIENKRRAEKRDAIEAKKLQLKKLQEELKADGF